MIRNISNIKKKINFDKGKNHADFQGQLHKYIKTTEKKKMQIDKCRRV